MGLIITADLIRRFPFAVNPARMTASIEGQIAKDMKAAALAEGHRPAYPKPANPAKVDAELHRSKVEAAIFRALMTSGEMTIGALRNATCYSRVAVEFALATMTTQKRLIENQNGRSPRGGTVSMTYRINPRFNQIVISNSPAVGDCGPAQPGNTAVNPPQGSDRPCGVEVALIIGAEDGQD